jgi:hypothetical protein
VIDRDAAAEAVARDGAAAGLDRLRIDVCEAERLGEAVAEHRKRDEGRPRAPFVNARLPRHAARLEVGDVFLPKAAAAAVEVLHIVHAHPAERALAPRPKPAQRRLDVLMLDRVPETQEGATLLTVETFRRAGAGCQRGYFLSARIDRLSRAPHRPASTSARKSPSV